MAALQITLLGCGKMGSAMLRGWLADPLFDANFTIIEPYHEHLDWADAYSRVVIYSDCQTAVASGAPVSLMIVLAVNPQMMGEAIAAIGSLRDADTAFLKALQSKIQGSDFAGLSAASQAHSQYLDFILRKALTVDE